MVLVRVGDRESDLGARAVVAREAGDRDRPRVALEVRDERMVRAIDGSELPELGLVRQGFGPLKRARREASPSCSKTARTVATSPSRSGRTRMVGPCLSLIARVCMSQLEKPTLVGWKSQPSVAYCAQRVTAPAPRICSIASALSVLGEKWSLLVIRELALSVHRFDEIQRNTGAPRDILTSRLRELEAGGRAREAAVPGAAGALRVSADPVGDELRPILLSLAAVGRPLDRQSRCDLGAQCGAELELVHTCEACGGEVTGLDLKPKRAGARRRSLRGRSA